MIDYNDIKTKSLRHLYLESQWEKIDFNEALKLEIDKLKDTPFIRIGVWEYERFSDDYWFRVLSYHRVSDKNVILAGIVDYTTICNYLRKIAFTYKEQRYYEAIRG